MHCPPEEFGFQSSSHCQLYVTFQLAALEDKVYVMHKVSNRIHVYNISKPFSILEWFTVKDFKSPHDVAACAISNCLYVTDLETRCIWKIVPSDRQATRWLSNLEEPFTLSVSNDGRVIVPRDGQPSFVEIYNSYSVLIQSVQLPEQIQHPKRAIETPTGNVILLHRCSNHSVIVLSEVTKNGDIVHRFLSGDEGEVLNDGCRLAIILNEDFIEENSQVAVIDCDNSKVIIFNSELNIHNVMNSDKWRRCLRE